MLSDPFVPRGGEKWRGGGPTPNPLPVVKRERERSRKSYCNRGDGLSPVRVTGNTQTLQRAEKNMLVDFLCLQNLEEPTALNIQIC